MADLKVNSKGAGNRSLDHPNFGSVYKTAFKKGTISDFKKLQDDPIKVVPMVKVKIDGTETPDYIPIYFRPKEGFWPTDEFNPADFNEAEQYFETSWQSFRGDDEVNVLSQEGEPLCVVAFADRYPRVGEDIFRLDDVNQYHDNYYLSMIHQDLAEGIDSSELGPDGKDLGLKLDLHSHVGPLASTPYGDLTYGEWFSYLLPQSIEEELYNYFFGLLSMPAGHSCGATLTNITIYEPEDPDHGFSNQGTEEDYET